MAKAMAGRGETGGKGRGASPEVRLVHLTGFLLQQREAVSFEAIREAFPDFYTGSAAAVDKKWTRDKQALLAAGVPLQFVEGAAETEEGYLVDPRAYYLDNLRLEPAEAAVLFTAGSAAARMPGHPWRDELDSALQKLAAALGEGVPRAGLPAGRPADGLQGRRLGRFLEDIGQAVRGRKRIAVEYLNRNLELTRREVDVYGFAWRRGVWLFAGYCHARQGVRVFYVDRLRGLRLLHPRRRESDYRIPRDFDIRTYSRQQPWEYRAHAPLEAAVRLKGALGALAPQLFPGARAEREGGGACCVRLAATDLPALVRHVLALGPEAELVSPEAGRCLAREVLETLAAQLRAPEEGAAG